MELLWTALVVSILSGVCFASLSVYAMSESRKLRERNALLEELVENLTARNEQLEPGARLLGDESEMGLQDCKRDSQPKLRAVGKDE